MKKLLTISTAMVLALGVAACNQSPTEASADSQADAVEASGDVAADQLNSQADVVEDSADTQADAIEDQADQATSTDAPPAMAPSTSN
jgi:hypothetical protein